MKTFFDEAFNYTYHFNDKVLNSLIVQHVNIPEKALLLINHTLNAHEIWNHRIMQQPVETNVWEVRPIDRLKTINENNLLMSKDIILNFDLEKIISYTNSSGNSYTNSVKDVLFHIINHSTYHRGQIATDCKLNGMTPLVTDYIFYKREG